MLCDLLMNSEIIFTNEIFRHDALFYLEKKELMMVVTKLIFQHRIVDSIRIVIMCPLVMASTSKNMFFMSPKMVVVLG